MEFICGDLCSLYVSRCDKYGDSESMISMYAMCLLTTLLQLEYFGFISEGHVCVELPVLAHLINGRG
jgi:hypothetical protein